MTETQIAAQLYTVRDFCKTPNDLAESLRKIKAIGYDVVQVSGVGPIEYGELKKILDDTQIRVCCTHIPYDRMKNEPNKVRGK